MHAMEWAFEVQVNAMLCDIMMVSQSDSECFLRCLQLVNVMNCSTEAPTRVEITALATELEIGKPTQVGSSCALLMPTLY